MIESANYKIAAVWAFLLGAQLAARRRDKNQTDLLKVDEVALMSPLRV